MLANNIMKTYILGPVMFFLLVLALAASLLACTRLHLPTEMSILLQNDAFM